jgi:hypothetical protein
MATNMCRNGFHGTKHIKNNSTYHVLHHPSQHSHTKQINKAATSPENSKKLWKKEISTYHVIRKTIKFTTQNNNWRTHPLVTNLQNHPHANIPNPPNDPMLINDWIKILETIGKTTKKNARDIITKQTTINCKKEISKYRNTLNLQPKRIHKVIFKNTENTTLYSIKDR